MFYTYDGLVQIRQVRRNDPRLERELAKFKFALVAFCDGVAVKELTRFRNVAEAMTQDKYLPLGCPIDQDGHTFSTSLFHLTD